MFNNRSCSAAGILALGLLPYLTTVKLPPYPSFWAELVAGSVLLFLFANRWWSRRFVGVHEGTLSWSAISLAALAFLALLRIALAPTEYRSPALLFAGYATAGAFLVSVVGTWKREGYGASVSSLLAIGLLIALAANAVAVGLDLMGWRIHMLSLIWIQPPVRAIGLLGQPNELAVISVICWAAAWHLWLNGRVQVPLLLSLQLITAFVVAAAASRAGYVCWVVVIALSVLSLRARALVKRQDVTVLWASVVLFLLFQIGWTLWRMGTDAGVAGTAVRTDTIQRIELARDALALWWRHPFLGVGVGQFSAARWVELSGPMMETNAAHAHNIFLQLLAESGLLGLIIVVVPLLNVTVGTLRQVRKTGVTLEVYFPLAVVTALLIYSQFEYPLWYSHYFFIFLIAFALLPQTDSPFRLRLSRSTLVVAWLAGVLGCCVLVPDYIRLQRTHTQFLRQQAMRPQGPWMIPLEVRSISLLTLFPLQAEFMHVRTLGLGEPLNDDALALARRVMLGVTNTETVGRYCALLLAADQRDEADRWLAASRRNQQLFRGVLGFLHQQSVNDPKIKKYLDQRGL